MTKTDKLVKYLRGKIQMIFDEEQAVAKEIREGKFRGKTKKDKEDMVRKYRIKLYDYTFVLNFLGRQRKFVKSITKHYITKTEAEKLCQTKKISK